MDQLQPWMLGPIFGMVAVVMVVQLVIAPNWDRIWPAIQGGARALMTWWQQGQRRAEELAEARHARKLAAAGVNRFVGAPFAELPAVMSQAADSRQTDQTDSQTDRVFADPMGCGKLKVDRTRGALIEVLVYNGWGTGEIRALLKGDTGATGAEVAAARERLGLAMPESRVVLVRQAGIERRVAVTDADYPYEAPPA